VEIDPNQLPNDTAALRQIVVGLLGEAAERERKLRQMQHWVEQLLRARYGPLDEIAWYGENSGNETLHPVGEKRANEFGLYDMLGNAYEWVNDWYDENYYQNSPSQDPGGPAGGPMRVYRGGAWGNSISSLVRVSVRERGLPGVEGADIGFRCGGEVFAPAAAPPVSPATSSTSPVSNSPEDTEADSRMRWGMSKEQVSQIFHGGDKADVKLDEAGTDALVYRNDGASTSDHIWYYFKEGKLVETRQIQVDGYPPSWYDEMREKMTKKYGQPVPGRVPPNLEPVRSDAFDSPRSVIILILSKNEDCPGDPCVSEIFLDRSQVGLAAR
jgi:hypothetical protein